jgi:hypothetical protein
LQAGRVQSAKITFPALRWPGLAHDVHEQPRHFEVGVAGGIDERQVKLATALGYFTGDERRDKQWRLRRFFAFCLDQRRGDEPVYHFDLRVEAVIAALNQQIDDGISATITASWDPADLGANSGGLLECLPSGMQYSAFAGCHRHGNTRMFNICYCTRYVNNGQL